MFESELDNLRILLKLTSILSVSPDYKTIKHGGKSALNSTRLYAITLASIIITAYGISLHGAIRHKYAQYHDSRMDIILDSVTTLLFTISAVISVISPVLHYNTWAEFLKSLRFIAQTTGHSKHTITTTRLNIELLCVNAVFGLRFLWSVYAWNNSLGIDVSKYYVFRHAIEYFSLISIALMIYLNKILTHSYRLLNESAEHAVLPTAVEQNKIRNKIKPSIAYIDSFNAHGSGIKNIYQNYRKLRRLVFLFNRIFGLQILFVLGITIMSMLEGLNYAMKQTGFLMLTWSGSSTLFSLVSLTCKIKYF